MAHRRDPVAPVKRLRHEIELDKRFAGTASSRWWRLHPKLAAWRLVSRLVGSAFPRDFDGVDTELCLRVSPYTMTPPERIYALARAVEYTVGRQLPGAMVECGVWRGGSMMVVALTLLRLGVTDRELYLFDTFEGMTEPSEEDVKYSGERATDILARTSRDSNVWGVAPLEQVREAVLSVGYPEERIHFVKGAVEETLPTSAPEEIALLRLDTDWYSSTKHELLHLYPRLVHGGVLMLDDYGFWRGARQAVDEYLAENEVVLLLDRIDEEARIAIKT